MFFKFQRRWIRENF